jgi:hypothetical protein
MIAVAVGATPPKPVSTMVVLATLVLTGLAQPGTGGGIPEIVAAWTHTSTTGASAASGNVRPVVRDVPVGIRIIWRNHHVTDPLLRKVVTRANVA